MNIVEKDIVLENLRDEYKNDVVLLIRQNFKRHHGSIDFKSLNDSFILICTKTIGRHLLSDDDWLDLIYDVTPDIYESLFYRKLAS